MPETIRTTGRPPLPRQQGLPQDAVVAQSHDYLGGLPSADGELHGLLRGLASFDPALAGYTQDAQQKAHKDAQQAKADDLIKGRAAGQTADSPMSFLTGGGQVDQRDVPDATGSPEFVHGFQESAAHRAGMKIKLDAIHDWDSKRNDPAFDPASWMNELRQKSLAGMPPRAQAIIGEHLTALDGQITGEYEKAQSARRDQANIENTQVIVRNAVGNTPHPDELPMAFLVAKAQLGTQVAPKAIVDSFVTAVVAQSDRMGGMPELLAGLTTPGKDGKSILDGHPEMANHVRVAEHQALEMRSKAIAAAALPINERTALLREHAIKSGDSLEQYGAEWIISQTGPNGLYKTPSEVSAAYGQYYDAMLKKNALGDGLALAASGTLFRAEGGVANKVLDKIGAPGMARLVAAMQRGDQGAADAESLALVKLVSGTRTGAVWDQLKGLIDSHATTVPSDKGPDPAFLAMASLHKAMESSPLFTDKYFPDKIGKVFSAFNNASQGTDKLAAYKAAYQSIDPATIDAEKKLTESPTWKAWEAEKRAKLVGGVGIVGKYIPFIGSWFRPDEHRNVSSAMDGAARQFLLANPSATDKQVMDWGGKWVTRNFAYDKTTNQAVKVPEDIGGERASDAISSFTSDIYDAIKKTHPDWVPTLTPQGTGGSYRVTLFNGMAQQALPDITLDNILKAHTSKTSALDSDRASFGAMQKALRAGQPLPEVDPKVIAKGAMLGILPEGAARGYHQRELDKLDAAIKGIPAMGLGDFHDAPILPVPKVGTTVDHRMTSQVVKEFMTPGEMQRGMVPLARMTAALITAGEGVASKPYQDPRREAGTNIGMGYNLKANAATVDMDLAAAGVSPGDAAGVKAGTRALTVEQSKALLLAVVPRYTELAQKAADKALPGLWSKMTNQQRAVMTDIGYQTGNPAQFAKALQSLAKGDTAAWQQETKVFYRKTDGGPLIEDATRTGHRAAFLAGQGIFQARVGQLATIPSNALQALATTTN